METKRLILRERTLEMIQEWITHTPERQMEFLGIEDEKELQLQIGKNERLLIVSHRKWRLWDILEKETKRVVGNCGFHNWLPDHEKTEIGYRLYESFRNKGYMSEVIGKVVEHGFKEMHLNRIEACISPDNVPSIKLVERMGFQKEGVLREHYKIEEEIHDSVIYSLLKREYFNL